MGSKRIAETLTESELVSEVSRVVSDVTGVQLGGKQVTLVQSRMAKRMRELKISSPLEYSRYYNANESIEIGILISLLTTHHTFFFREFQHFEFVLKVSLPKIVASHREKGLKKIRIWSAACSRGHEVYSLAMFLSHHLPQLASDMSFEIVGTDICEESVGIAKNGVYPWEELRVAPSVYLQGNWSRGSGEIQDFVRANKQLKSFVNFRVLNLLELEKSGLSKEKFDLIFVRNVFIYFSQENIKSITSNLLKSLNNPGHIFVGLSESLNGMSLPIEWSGPSVYENRDPKSSGKSAPAAVGAAKSESRPPVKPLPAAHHAPSAAVVPSRAAETPFQEGDRKIRVLCVDDSLTILTLFKRILTAELGFEIIGTAGDGIEAAEKARLLKPDVITLDIHMPKMGGVELLEKHGKELQAPVVVVSSVSRDDAALAFRCLELGASDYIEKPSTVNLEKIQEELCFKLRVADSANRKAQSGPTRSRALELDAIFRRPPPIANPSGKLRVVLCNFASRDVALVLLKGFSGGQPGTLVLLEGAGDLFEEWVQREGAGLLGGNARNPKSLSELIPNSIFFVEMEKGLKLLAKEGHAFTISTLVVGPLNKAMVEGVKGLSTSHLILEDRGVDNPKSLMTKVNMVAPVTSFVYESTRFLAEAEAFKKASGQ